MSLQHPVVDRRTELGIFLTLLDDLDDRCESILLLKDESGQGKSKLLYLYESYCRENQIPVSRVDFKGGYLTPINVLRTIQTDFRPINLRRCSDTLQFNIAAPPVEISDNTGIGQTHYSVQTTVNISGITIVEQRNRWETGAQAFIDDLFELSEEKTKHFVVLFDTYEQANEDTKKWLSNHILRMATPQRLNSLCVVIAGKEIPQASGEWEHCYKRINLEPLRLEDWLEYASLVVGNIPSDYVERIYARYKNSPLEMANVINALAPIGEV